MNDRNIRKHNNHGKIKKLYFLRRTFHNKNAGSYKLCTRSIKQSHFDHKMLDYQRRYNIQIQYTLYLEIIATKQELYCILSFI